MPSWPVAECLGDFFQHHATDETIALLAEFVRVQPKTVERWRGGKQLPTGETALRLRVFLEAIGYRPRELAQMQTPTRTMVRLIGYGAYDVETVQDMLGYASPQAVYRVLDGRTSPAKTQAYRLERVDRDSSGELNKVKSPWEERLARLRQAVQEHQAMAVDWITPREEVQPTELMAGAPVSTPPAKRRRERPRRADESVAKGDASNLTVKALTHVIFAFDDLVSNGDTRQLALLVKERVSPKRLQALKRFLDQALKD